MAEVGNEAETEIVQQAAGSGAVARSDGTDDPDAQTLPCPMAGA